MWHHYTTKQRVITIRESSNVVSCLCQYINSWVSTWFYLYLGVFRENQQAAGSDRTGEEGKVITHFCTLFSFTWVDRGVADCSPVREIHTPRDSVSRFGVRVYQADGRCDDTVLNMKEDAPALPTRQVGKGRLEADTVTQNRCFLLHHVLVEVGSYSRILESFLEGVHNEKISEICLSVYLIREQQDVIL